MPMSREQIIEKLREILLAADDRNREVLANCTEGSHLTTDLGFTSVSLLYMVIAVEEEFGIRFDDVTVSDFDTLGDVVDYLAARVS